MGGFSWILLRAASPTSESSTLTEPSTLSFDEIAEQLENAYGQNVLLKDQLQKAHSKVETLNSQLRNAHSDVHNLKRRLSE